MKFVRIDKHTARLSLTYLLIIMVLTISFSVILFHTSVGMLQVQLRTPSSGDKKYDLPSGLRLQGSYSSADIDDVNNYFQSHIAAARKNTIRQLILLNGAVLIVGSGLSYFLARRSLRPIERALEAQARFASDASHELRTPLAVMRAENEATLKKYPSGPIARLIKSNLEEISHLNKLSDGLLRLAREDHLEFTTVWVDEVAMSAINKVLPLARSKRISIVDLWPHTQVIADEHALVQTAVILVENAIKYSPKNSTIQLDSIQEDGRLLIRVRDEGVGISDMHLPFIFDRFYRVTASGDKEYGHGLGLFIAQKLVGQMNGKLTATSQKGHGSIFSINLPIKR